MADDVTEGATGSRHLTLLRTRRPTTGSGRRGAGAENRNGSNERSSEMRSQRSRRKFLASAITAVALFLIIGIRFVGRAESTASHNGMPAKAGDMTQEKIARAMSAG